MSLEKLFQKIIKDVEKADDHAQNQIFGLVKSFKKQVLGKIAVKQLEIKKNSLIVPRDCRFIHNDGNNIIVVIEQKPQLRTIFFDHDDNYNLADISANVSFPYVVFTILFRCEYFSSIQVSYRPQPIASLDDNLYISNIPNTGLVNDEKKLMVCMGYDDIFPNLDRMELSKVVDKIITSFWTSKFTNYNYRYNAQLPNEVRTLDHWIVNSKTNPAFILRTKFPKSLTLRKQIKDLLKDCSVPSEDEELDVFQETAWGNKVKLSSDLTNNITKTLNKYFSNMMKKLKKRKH